MAKINKNGFSIIEILLAVALFLLIFLSASYLLIDNLHNSFDNQERVKAEFLAQEGLEAVKEIAVNDWVSLLPGQYGLALNNNTWQLAGQTEPIGQVFKNGERQITIEEVPGNEHLKKVSSEVLWIGLKNQPQKTALTTYISNWREVVSLCSDGLDNDHDNLIDYPDDPGCSSAIDEDEADPLNLPQCSDGLDNDNDGIIDYPQDPGCESANDDEETDSPYLPQCSDDLDNDGDGAIDYPQDPGCESANDNEETDPLNLPQCSDNLDNDGDGAIDYPQDPNCDSANDDDESAPVILPQCSDGLDNDGDGLMDYPLDLGCDSPEDNDEANPVLPPSCLDNDQDNFNASQENCGPADCDDNNANINPGADEICNNNIDDNCNGQIDCQEQSCSSDISCQAVNPDIIFADQDSPLCEYQETTMNVQGSVILPAGSQAKLQLSYRIVNPENKRTETTYVNYGLVENGDDFSFAAPWPGIRPGEQLVEIHIGGMLLDPITNDPIMTFGVGLDYYWYPWVCPAPATECSDSQDNDGDGLIDFPQDSGCYSPSSDSEFGSCVDNDHDNYYTPGYECLPIATVQNNGNIVAPKGELNFKVITSQIQCGAGGSEIFVKTGLALNGNLNWLFGGNDVDGGETYSTTIDNNTNIYIRGYAWDNSCLPQGRGYNSNVSSPYVLVLTAGDSLPNLPRFGNQQTLPEVLAAFLDANKKVDIDANQILLLYELGVTDLSSTAADFQDLVVLMTFMPDTLEYCQCGPFDCDDANSAIHPGSLEINNNIDDDCDFQVDEGF